MESQAARWGKEGAWGIVFALQVWTSEYREPGSTFKKNKTECDDMSLEPQKWQDRRRQADPWKLAGQLACLGKFQAHKRSRVKENRKSTGGLTLEVSSDLHASAMCTYTHVCTQEHGPHKHTTHTYGALRPVLEEDKLSVFSPCFHLCLHLEPSLM